MRAKTARARQEGKKGAGRTAPGAETRMPQAAERAATADPLVRLKSTLEHAADFLGVSLVITDDENRISRVNPAFEALLGYPEKAVQGWDLVRVITAPPLPLGPGAWTEGSCRHAAGHLVPVFVLGAERGETAGQMCLIAIGPQAGGALTSQTLQAAKLASLGQLAAGVAHEINNPIGFIYSNLGTLKDYLADLNALLAEYRQLEIEVATGGSPPARQRQRRLAAARERINLDFVLSDIDELIDDSREGAARVARIVQGLREFARVGRPEQTPGDLNGCLAKALAVVHSEVRYRAQITEDYGALPLVPLNADELTQVFTALLINAYQALHEQGTISLRTYQEPGWVCAAVADTGAGMSGETRKHLFEPFYTTKPQGVGTGLGLSIAHDIVVHRHGGQLLVDSEEGKGTTFTVKLPLRPAAGQLP